MNLQYLRDENLPVALRSYLLQQLPGQAVWVVGSPGAPEKGTPDTDILSWCEAHHFVLVTANRRSMPAHLKAHLASGRHVPGVLIVRPQANWTAVINDLILIASASVTDEFVDSIVYIPL
jgi:hypothetical protein